MNRLPIAKRTHILNLLVEGNSLRAASRIADVSINTVYKLAIDAGEACSAYQDQAFRNLPCKRIQLDEIWSFVYAKQRAVPFAKKAPGTAGDVWTWVAICADTKLVPSWRVGDRSGATAIEFVCDLSRRLANRVQLTSDGHRAYLEAVEAAFGADVDYAQLVKLYGASSDSAKGRYSPAECCGAIKTPIEGKPDPKHISTSYAERSNLTMRMRMRRFTRLTNAFSKKVENHAAAIALHTMYYNFVRIHQTLRVTPAMAAGVTKKLWEVSDIVEMLEQWELANFKPEYQFVVRQYAIGKGHSVSVLWRGGEVDTIFGFEKENDALQWIKEKSQAWLVENQAFRKK